MFCVALIRLCVDVSNGYGTWDGEPWWDKYKKEKSVGFSYLLWIVRLSLGSIRFDWMALLFGDW